MLDVLIIGAGITGSLIAHELSKQDLKIALLDKENDVACHATKANSAIIHSGHDPKPGTLKARFNVEGNRMYPGLCEELKVDYKQIGAYVVSSSKEQNETLDNLMKQCEDRDIPYEVLDSKALHEKEPALADGVIKGIFLKTTGIVTPWQVCIAACEEAILNGMELYLNEEVTSIEKMEDGFKVFTQDQSFETKMIINCAGVYADKITEMLHPSPYHITPRKGEYYVLPKIPLVHSIIYPVPTKKGKGVLAVPTVHGNILIGPNASDIEDKEDVSTGLGLDEVRTKITEIIKDVPLHQTIHTYSGLRPSGDLHDFYIQEDDSVQNFIHVSCIDSPGLASAPAISSYVVKELVLPKFETKPKEEYIRRKKHIVFDECSDEEKNALIQQDPEYGKIVCRCEKVTLAEMKDVIHRPCGATTVQGVKRRVRAGMGKCQGGFCQPVVVNILAKELNVPVSQICNEQADSNVVVGTAKEDF